MAKSPPSLVIGPKRGRAAVARVDCSGRAGRWPGKPFAKQKNSVQAAIKLEGVAMPWFDLITGALGQTDPHQEIDDWADAQQAPEIARRSGLIPSAFYPCARSQCFCAGRGRAGSQQPASQRSKRRGGPGRGNRRAPRWSRA